MELESYFDELMHIANNADLAICVDTVRHYVIGPTVLKTMMHMLSNELDRGAR